MYQKQSSSLHEGIAAALGVPPNSLQQLTSGLGPLASLARLCEIVSGDGNDLGEVVMGITGAHILLYTSEPDALRAILRDVFGWKHVDAGEGWLIFALPPAELAVHPAEGPTYGSGMHHQFTLMCDDIEATMRELRSKGVDVRGEPQDEGWGITVMLSLPGDLEVLLYEPRHPVAASFGVS